MGKSRKLRQNKKTGRKSFRNLMTKSRKMMMTPFKNRFTRKIFGGAKKTWVVTLEKDEGSIPVVKKISVGNDIDHLEHLTEENGKWVMPVTDTTSVQGILEPNTQAQTEANAVTEANTQANANAVTEANTQANANAVTEANANAVTEANTQAEAQAEQKSTDDIVNVEAIYPEKTDLIADNNPMIDNSSINANPTYKL